MLRLDVITTITTWWVSVEFLGAPILRKGSGSTATITTIMFLSKMRLFVFFFTLHCNDLLSCNHCVIVFVAMIEVE